MQKRNRWAFALFAAFLLPIVGAAEPTIKEGTNVELEFVEPLSSATAMAGQKFRLKVSEDVKGPAGLLIPAGSKAIGIIRTAQKKGFMGKSGELFVSLKYVEVNGVQIPLRTSHSAGNGDRVGAAVALSVLFGPLGLLKRGVDVEIPAGFGITAEVDETTDLNPVSTQNGESK